MSVKVIGPCHKRSMTEDEIRFQVNNLQMPQWMVDKYVSGPLYKKKRGIVRIVRVHNTHSFMFVYARGSFDDPDLQKTWDGKTSFEDPWRNIIKPKINFVSECCADDRKKTCYTTMYGGVITYNHRKPSYRTCPCSGNWYLSADLDGTSVNVSDGKLLDITTPYRIRQPLRDALESVIDRSFLL